MDANDPRPLTRWRVFATLYVVLLLLALGLLGATEGLGWMRAVDLIDLAVTVVGSAGLIGFAFA